jgi:hypothetical protein
MIGLNTIININHKVKGTYKFQINNKSSEIRLRKKHQNFP